LQDLNTPEAKLWLSEMNDFQKAQVRFNELSEVAIWSNPVFSSAEFNKSLDIYLLSLKDFKTRFDYLMNSDQLDLALLSTKLFSNLYIMVGKKINSIHPVGMDELTFKDFHQAMKKVSMNFISLAEKLEISLNGSLLKGEYLTTASRIIASQEQIENPVFSSYTTLIMDDFKRE